MRIHELLDETARRPTRIVQHIRRGVPFLMVSANRGNLSPEQNDARDRQLVRKLRAMPVTVIPLDFGEFQEKGQPEPSREPSYFAMADSALGHTSVERLRHLGMKLARDYDQDSVAFGDGENVYYLEPDGTQAPAGNLVSFAKKVVDDAIGRSQIRGRKFTFTDQDKDAPNAIRYAEQPQARPVPRPNLP